MKWPLSSKPAYPVPLVTREGVGDAWSEFDLNWEWDRPLVLPGPIRDVALSTEEEVSGASSL